jgi:hypothetical protein
VSNNALADIKRTAKFTILDRGGINYLKDRIRPWCRLAVGGNPTLGPGAVIARNLFTNPSVETGLASMSTNRVTLTQDASWAKSGTYSVRATRTSDTNPDGYIDVVSMIEGGVASLKPNTLYTIGATLKLEAPLTSLAPGATGGQRISIFAYFNGGLRANPMAPNVAGEATLAATFTTPASFAGLNTVRLYAGGNPGESILWDAWYLVEGDYSGGYFDGDTASDIVAGGIEHEWVGAPHGSASIKRELIELPDTRPGYVEWPLGVFLLATPERTVDDDDVVMREVDAYDQLLVLQQDKVADRYSIPAGTVYTTAIATLVFGLAASIVPSSLTLATTLEWEPGTTKLRILNDLLAAINYESAWFDETGRLVCRPYQSPAVRGPEYTYNDDNASVITGKVGQTIDLFGVPNKWVLVKSEADLPAIVGTYTNTSPTSPTSTVSRGRVIVDFRTEEDAADQTTINAKAARLGFEASQVFENVKFNTAAMPMHSNADVVALKIDALAIDGKYSEHTWELPLETGATMAHTVRRVVSV